ncbi:MAG: HepT-like ribonuclease domain-containing protein [Phycisphaerales bacterium]
MSPEAWHDRVAVMIEDIDRIAAFIGPLTRDQFPADEKAVFAVCYAFVRLGQAVTNIPSDVIATNPQIEWGDIRHFRNFMVHVYLAVDPLRLFDTAVTDLPALRMKLEALLRTDPPAPQK